jgi:hypothetical protein
LKKTSTYVDVTSTNSKKDTTRFRVLTDLDVIKSSYQGQKPNPRVIMYILDRADNDKVKIASSFIDCSSDRDPRKGSKLRVQGFPVPYDLTLILLPGRIPGAEPSYTDGDLITGSRRSGAWPKE